MVIVYIFCAEQNGILHGRRNMSIFSRTLHGPLVTSRTLLTRGDFVTILIIPGMKSCESVFMKARYESGVPCRNPSVRPHFLCRNITQVCLARF